jgi:hypothetical protein
MKESKSMMKKEVGFMQKKGAPKSMIKHEKKEMASKTEKYAGGGGVGATGLTRAAQMSGRTMPTPGNPAAMGSARGAAMSGRTMPTTGQPTFSKGGGVGSASKRADGIAKKGKTKGKMVTMSKGGMAC